MRIIVTVLLTVYYSTDCMQTCHPVILNKRIFDDDDDVPTLW